MNNQIIFGDAKENKISDESIDLIVTDPVYSNLEDYEWLGYEAQRILKNDRALLVWGSQKKIKDYIPLIEKSGLEYVYTLSYVVRAKSARLNYYGNLFLWTSPCMWFRKGDFKLVKSMPDTFISDSKPKGTHRWNKNPGVINKWIKSFSKPNWQVVDFFCGNGVVAQECKRLKRNYLAYEIDYPTWVVAQEQVEQIMPDIFEQVKDVKLF